MRPLLAAVTVVLLASPVCAQPRESRVSFSSIGGVGKTYDDEGSLGKGLLIGCAIDRVVIGTTRLEGSIELLTHDRESGFFESTGQSVIAGLSVVHRFGRGSGQPYVFGGMTLGHHAGTNTFSADHFPVSSTNAGTRFGFGIALRAGAKVEISPELRMNSFFTSRDSDPWMVPSFGMRVGWRL